ncbi:MAG: GH3 auxin-responsive promoter family protein [Chitinophagales bacterium]
MKVKSLIIKPIAKWISRKVYQTQSDALEIQEKTLQNLVSMAKSTVFGKDFSFDEIKEYKDFKAQVPVKDYEQLRPYFDRIVAGESDICWQGKPLYFAKTSGTTSGAKYIPITKDSIQHHMTAARNALLCYVAETGKADFFDGKMIFLQGSPEMAKTNGIDTGRLSGIVYHHVPKWLMSNRKPSFVTNCIEDWEKKLNNIVAETIDEDMTLISGIPPWCVMYFERLLEKSTAKDIQSIFKNFKLFVYGGVNYAPYRQKIESLIGFPIDSIETYPASEGFFAYQDSQEEQGLLLNVDAGIFYEFVPTTEIFNINPTRLSLAEIELNKNYVLIASTNAGLWAYNTGDTVKFVSKSPYRILVTGRVKHFISAFGEHVIAEEVEHAMTTAAKEFDIEIVEFTVAPFISEDKTQESYHEWCIEAKDNTEINTTKLSQRIDEILQSKNVYYQDLRAGNILALPKITWIKNGGFMHYREQAGKLGGQNKVQHLANDRKLVNQLLT